MHNQAHHITVYCDFDGTVTIQDCVDMLLRRLAHPEWREWETQWEQGHITSRECMARQVPLLAGGWDAIEACLPDLQLEADFEEFSHWCRANQIPLYIVSEGLDRVIHWFLQKRDIPVSGIFANRLEGQGCAALSLQFPFPSDKATCRLGLCKCQILERLPEPATPSASPLRVVIGDGASDFCWAQNADLLFAKKKLKAYCERMEIPHQPFEGFQAIQSHLTEVLALRKKGILSLPTAPTLPKEEVTTTRKVGVLLIHGLTGTPSELRPVVKHLSNQGYRVEAPMICGHGGTHQDLLRTTWQAWLAGVQEALDCLSLECDEVYVGGLSMGAVLALMLAANNPHVKGLMLLSPHMGLLQDNLQFNQILLPLGYALKLTHDKCYWTEKPPYGLKDQRLQKSIKRAIKASESGETANYGLFRTYVGSLYQLDGLIRHAHANIHRVQCPTLCVQSLEDTVTKVDNATNLYAALGSRQKQLHLLMGCNHVMTVDLRKKDVSRLMENFIQHGLENELSLVHPEQPAPDEGRLAESTLHIQVLPRANKMTESEWLALCAQVPMAREFSLEEIQCHRLSVADHLHSLFDLHLYELPLSSRKVELEELNPAWLRPVFKALIQWIPGWVNPDGLVVCSAGEVAGGGLAVLENGAVPQDLPENVWNLTAAVWEKLKSAFRAARPELLEPQPQSSYPNAMFTAETLS